MGTPWSRIDRDIDVVYGRIERETGVEEALVKKPSNEMEFFSLKKKSIRTKLLSGKH